MRSTTYHPPTSASEIPWEINITRYAKQLPQRVVVTLKDPSFQLDVDWCLEHLNGKQIHEMHADVLSAIAEQIQAAADRARNHSEPRETR